MSISKHVDDHMLADRHCFLVFHLNCYGSPPGVAISLLPLWFPWGFYVIPVLELKTYGNH